MLRRNKWLVCVALLIVAAGFRISVAHWLPNDAPGDSRVYAQLARNMLERHVYSHEEQPPFDPSLIRLPGYPLFLAGVYSIFGHTNNGAVRIAQALIDAATCGLIALLAFYWQPDEKKKRASAIAALALAAICPFTTIYAATILTEVPTIFLVMAIFVAATLAFRKTFATEDTEAVKNKSFKHSLIWWSVAGLLGGLLVLFRPDNGLFVAAIGVTLVVTVFRVPTSVGPLARAKDPTRVGTRNTVRNWRRKFARVFTAGSFFSIVFVLVLTPWSIRNWRVFHLFQPLAPAHGEMPGEFVPRGYNLWVRTWLDDESYIQTFLWSLDSDPIDPDDVPQYAFDSAQEKDRVLALLDKYNHPDGSQTASASPTPAQSQPNSTPAPSPSASLLNSSNSKATPSPIVQPQKNSNTNANAEESSDENDNSGDESEEVDESKPEQAGPVEMTPVIDAGFGQLARERIARHPFRFYVWLPIKRARTMWFDTHSQYWPFEGTLLPLEDLDYEGHQQYWLPLFAGLTALYTLLGLAGAWILWSSAEFSARRWLLLAGLAIVLRLVLFSSIENPEPRYLVEFFPFLSILGGIAIAKLEARTSLSALRAKHVQ